MTDINLRIRKRFDHAAAKKNLQEKYQGKMLFAHAGGMWQAGPELLTILHICNDPDVVLLDVYGNPVKVNKAQLFELASARWQEQMNAWLVDHTNISAQR